MAKNSTKSPDKIIDRNGVRKTTDKAVKAETQSPPVAGRKYDPKIWEKYTTKQGFTAYRLKGTTPTSASKQMAKKKKRETKKRKIKKYSKKGIRV